MSFNVFKNMSLKLKNYLNLYFLDFPVEEKRKDYIGYESYVDSLKMNIDENAKIIGIIAEYGSGKSTIISLLKKKLSKNLFKYKIVRVNLWDSKDNKSELQIHKKFLYQLAANLKKNDVRNLQYINKKLNPNYNNLNVSTRDLRSTFLFFTSVTLFIINLLYKNNVLQKIQIPTFLNSEWIRELCKNICELSGVLSIIFFVSAILISEIIVSIFRKEENKSLTENDTIEIYIQLVNNYIRKWYQFLFFWKPKKLIIVIEDLDRIVNPDEVKNFLKEIFTFYSHSTNQNITFIIAIKPEHYLLDNEENVKIFDFVIDLKRIMIEDYQIITKKILLEKRKRYIKKLGIDVQEDSGIWMWLVRGENINIRQIKYRINEAILMFSTLKNRFKDKSIKIESCIAMTYLKNEYPENYQKLTEEYYNGEQLTFVLKSIVNSFISNHDITAINLRNMYPDSKFIETGGRLEKDISDLIKNKYIRDDCYLYCFNYPAGNKIFDFNQSKIYNSYMYDESLIDSEDLILDLLNKDDYFLITAYNHRKELNLEYPKMIFDSVAIFDKIYDISKEEEKNFIMKEMLKISPKTYDVTIERLNKIKDCKCYNEEFINRYIDSIEIRGEYDDVEIIKIRNNLLSIFKNNQETLIKLYKRNNYPIIEIEELDKINNFSMALSFIEPSQIDEDNIIYIANFLNNGYREDHNQELMKFLYEIPEKTIFQFISNLTILSKLSEEDKHSFHQQMRTKINFDNLSKIKKYITIMSKCFEDLEIKMIELVRDNQELIAEYCNIIDMLSEFSTDTLVFISSDLIDYGFKPSIQKEMYKNKMFDGYVKSKINYEKKFEIEEKKINILGDSYKKIYKRKNNYYAKYIIESPSALEFFKLTKTYRESGEINIIYMSYAKQDYELLNYSLDVITSGDILNNYFLNIKEISIADEDFLSLLIKYENKFLDLSYESYRNLYSVLNYRMKRKLYIIRRRTK